MVSSKAKPIDRTMRVVVTAACAGALFAVLLASGLASQASRAFAEGDGVPAFPMTGYAGSQDARLYEPAGGGLDVGPTPADDCVVTVYYCEYAAYDDPDASFDEMGRKILGYYQIDGLQEGEVLDAWNYVVDIPGYFFFDGWPAKLTVSTDPSQNVLTLIYVNSYDSEFTVNYYLMEGADLTADSWTGALAPSDVEFVKLGSETVKNQRIDSVVAGDAYEYKLDDVYVIDSYPSQIRLGVDPDDNVINVLYVPAATNLPDDLVVPDETDVPDDGGAGSVPPDTGDAPDAPDSGSGDAAAPGKPDGGGPGDAVTPDSPGTDGGSGGSGGASSPDEPSVVPPDQGFDKDEIVDLLPSGPGSEEVVGDFVGTDKGDGVEITDEMIANPVDEEEAKKVADAFYSGMQYASLAKTGDTLLAVAAVVGGVALVALIAVAVAFTRRSKSK